MAVVTIITYDAGYNDAALGGQDIIYNADYQDVLLASPVVVFGPPKLRYDMRGFDSVDDTKVFWYSYDTPNTAPLSTTPALIGTLVYPHILADNLATS